MKKHGALQNVGKPKPKPLTPKLQSLVETLNQTHCYRCGRYLGLNMHTSVTHEAAPGRLFCTIMCAHAFAREFPQE